MGKYPESWMLSLVSSDVHALIAMAAIV